MEFVSERSKLSNGTYTRALVDSDTLECGMEELSPDTEYQDLSQGGGEIIDPTDGDQNEDMLG